MSSSSSSSSEIEVVTVFDSRHLVIDLSYEYNAHTIFWPGGEGFNLCINSFGDSPLPENAGVSDFYAAGTFSCAEHGGTHVDAPYHFYKHGKTVEKLRLNDLILPCRVIKVPSRNAEIDDVLEHERVNGTVPEGCAVLFDFDWASRYSSGAAAYLGYDEAIQGKFDFDTCELAFPGLSEAVSTLLVARKVAAVGLDTASLDPGACKSFASHRILLENGIYGIENINGNIALMPPKGSTLMVMPMKLTGGTGAPSRVVAFLPPAVL